MEKLFFGLTVMIIGIATVFLGLTILIGAIKLVSKIILSVQKPKQDGGKKESAPIQAPAAAPEVKPNVVAAAPAQDQAQLIAVITAALMACQQNGKQMVVRAVRRVGRRSAWSDAGRREQLML